MFEEDLTVLVGPNNIGKSRVLRALALALGAVPANRDDFSVGEVLEPTIDVVLSPAASSDPSSSSPDARDGSTVDRSSDEFTPDNGEETFDERLVPRLGAAIRVISTDPDRERFAWRTCIRSSLEGHGARVEHLEMVYDDGDWDVREGFRATPDQRSVVGRRLGQHWPRPRWRDGTTRFVHQAGAR